MKVSVTKQARADIAQAAEWYERRTEGAGEKFLDQVEQALEKIALAPTAYRKVTADNRRCNLEKFPYALWFKIEGEAIVVGCLHAKRSPVLAKERGAGVREMQKPE